MPYKDPEKQRQAWRKHYAKHGEKYRERQRQRRVDTREFLREAKRGKSCLYCGFDNPVALEFHHRDPKEKLFNVAKPEGRSIKTLKAEIEKCDLICANCHKIEHSEWS